MGRVAGAGALAIIAALLAGCQSVAPSSVIITPTTAAPSIASSTPTAAPSSSAPAAFEIVPCTIAVKDGFPIPGGDRDCRGSSGPTLDPGTGLGTYHVTDNPRVGSIVAFRVTLHNRRSVPSGPITIVILGPSSGGYFFTDVFRPVGCAPKCAFQVFGTDNLMTSFQWTAGVNAGQTVTFTAEYKALVAGVYNDYLVGVVNETAAQWLNNLFVNAAAGHDPTLIAEWDGVQSVVSD